MASPSLRPGLIARLSPSHAVVVAAALAYALTATRYVLGGDNGEFATIAETGGIAHPPGYPLYALYLRALRFLPAASPAHRAALATAILAVLTVVALDRACRAWGSTPWGSALACALYVFSPLAWRLGTQAEVFTPNALIAALILGAASPQAGVRGTARVAVLGGLAGLGLSNHHTIVLLAPIGIYGAVFGLLESPRRLVAAASGVGALAAGLLPYAALLVIARGESDASAIAWGDVTTPAGLLHHFLRADYGTTQLGLSKVPPQPLAQLVVLGASLARQLLFVPVVAALAGAAIVVRRRPRAAGWALAATFVLAGPAFVARFNVPPDGLGHLIVERFHLLPLVVASVLVGVGASALEPRLPPRSRVRPALVGGALAAGVFVSLPDVLAEHRPDVERYLRDALASAPENAIVLGTGDHRHFGFPYVQSALGVRRDVTFIDPIMLHYPWYRRRVHAAVGVEPVVPQGRSIDTRVLIANLLATKRPVLLTDLFAPVLATAFPSSPRGLLIEMRSPGEAPAELSAVDATNADLFGRFAPPGPPAEAGSWAALARRDYARTWLTIADAHERAGNAEASYRARVRAAQWE